MDDRGVCVLRHGVWRAETGRDFVEKNAGRGVVVFKISRVADGGEKVVIGQKFHARDVEVLLQLAETGLIMLVQRKRQAQATRGCTGPGE